ncbi:flagellar hook-length control protein FliK [Halothiobacillus sp. DCM-1]|uniref:flagellar hook-length control protein FliK n=1 Tax=Halothiobacillus sp. DCM-1 TaxID=3112558 RepID=UPI00324DC257
MSLSINPATTLTSTTELRGIPLKTGQVLSAIVLEANQHTGQALLSLAGGQVRVQTQQPLTTGSAIRLTVQTPGPPLVLSLQPDPPATTPATASGGAQPTALLNRLLGELAQRLNQTATPRLAQGDPSGEATGQPSAATRSSLATPSAPLAERASTETTAVPLVSLPKVLQRALLALGETPQTNPPTAPPSPRPAAQLADALASLLQNNSLPSPAARAQPMAAPPHTLHAALRTAALQLRQTAPSPASPAPSDAAPSVPAPATPTATQTLVNQWLTQLETSQLRTAVQQLNGQPAWLIDVPVNWQEQAHRLQLTVQPDHTAAQAPTGDSPWRLDFALDLPGLGALHGSLRLQGQALRVHLYADRVETQTALNAELPRLDQHLRAAEFTPDHLAVYPGPPPASARDRLTPTIATPQALLAVKV